MKGAVCSAHTSAATLEDALVEISSQLGEGPFRALLFFASPRHDCGRVSEQLHRMYPNVAMVGCSTAGELSDQHSGRGGISVLALTDAKVARVAAALANYEDGNVEAGVHAALLQLARELDVSLRDLDPKRWVGIMLVEGFTGSEERVNAALGSAAPFLSFVGGSAGDDKAFASSTQCSVGATTTETGCALLLLEMRVPFAVLKTTHFVPTSHVLVPTRVDGRDVHEFNGRPASEAYAAALGMTPDELSASVFFNHPVGLVIDGDPWLRSPVRVMNPGGSIHFACEVPVNAQLCMMESTGDLVGNSAAAFDRVATQLGGNIGGAVLFNCVYRRIEMDRNELHERFVQLLRFPAAGFHTQGESWIGHINQTLTALVIG